MTDQSDRKGKTAACVLLAWLLCAAMPATGQSLGDGIAAFALQDYERAREIFEPLARAGNAEAAFRLGWMIESGHGIAADPAVAASWYRSAADAGHVEAKRRLADMIAEGRGAGESSHETLLLLERAAEAGSVRAMIRLGRAYAAGEGAPLDPDLALDWFERAATTALEGPLHDYAQAAAAAIAANNRPAPAGQDVQ